MVFEEYRGRVLDKSEGQTIGELMGTRKAAILRHHGLLTVGRTVEEAVWWFIAMDRACYMHLMAEAASTPRLMSKEEAKLAHRRFGNANQARHSLGCWPRSSKEEEPEVLD